MEGAAAAEEGVTRFDAHGSAAPPPHKILAAYLVRIGLDPAHYVGRLRGQAVGDPPAEGRQAPSETLRLLHRAHVCSIPFRSFSLGPEEDCLDIARVYRDVVRDKKGGTSFESNVLFAWALERILGCQVDFLEASLCAASQSCGVSTRAHVCLLVHLDGQAWLADAAGGGLSLLCSGDRFPGTPLEPLLFEAGLEQVQDSGHFRISRRWQRRADGLPSESAPGSAAGPSSPACSARGEGGGGVATGVPRQPQVEREGTDAEEPYSTSQYSTEDPCSRDEWLLQVSAPREASAVDPRAVAGPSDAHEAEPWDYPTCSPASAAEPQAYPLDPQEPMEGARPAVKPSPAPEAPWVDLFCFSSWPRSLQHLEEVHRASLDGPDRVACRRRAPEEGGGRAVLLQTEYLVVHDNGTIQEHEAVASATQFFDTLQSAFGICAPASQQRPLPEPRDPPSAGRLPVASGAPTVVPWRVAGEAGTLSERAEGEQEGLLRQEEPTTESSSKGADRSAANSTSTPTSREGRAGGRGSEEDGPQAGSSSSRAFAASPLESTLHMLSSFNPWA